MFIRRPNGTEQRSVTGSERVEFIVTPEDVAPEAYRVSLTNLSGDVVSGSLLSRFPVDRLVQDFAVQPSRKETIETILRALAVLNPGLGTAFWTT